MADHLLQGFGLFLQWEVLFSMIGGVLVGMIIGALPGMTIVMAISLALPFTFYMEPVVSIAFVLGIYKAGCWGGSIPAILIGTPGTPASAATVIDGYAMAKKGQARKALETSLYASTISDVITDIITVVATFQIAYLALKIGPIEFFSIIVFSLTIIASVSTGSLLKGLISGGLGLLLATVGMDTMYSINRFTFGSIDLTGGFNIIPVLIGLFAIPEIMSQLSGKKMKGGKGVMIEDRLLSGSKDKGLTWPEFKGLIPIILRGSIIGSIIGVIPGLGAAPAAYLNYSRSKSASKHPEEYGKGSIEGVAAAESGSGAVSGPTLIPLLTLGVPGDKSTAVILGALMIQGLTPGPLLIQKHAPVVYGIFIAMVVINFVLFGFGKVALRWASLTGRAPAEILFPVVFILCVFGSFAINSNLFDVWVMIVIGGLGYLMKQVGLPTEPFIIAFILCPLFENGLRRALIMSGGDLTVFVTTPISMLFLVLTAVSLLFLTLSKKKDKIKL
jgi:putative tricarboxylic transport membrane protein